MRAGLLVALLGGIIGVSSAVQALLAVGTQPVYQERVAFGWAALVLALLATGAVGLARHRPGVAGAIMVVDGLLGLGAILLFYINTWYALAVPCWLLAAALIIMEDHRAAQS